MADQEDAPDHTAVRVALWRAQHVELDQPPYVLEDRIGLQIAAPGENWRKRPDMNPRFTSGNRASMVARARFVEDYVEQQIARGVDQYVILGAGLDTFVQRKPEVAAHLRVFEVDQPGTQAWKRKRLAALGLPTPDTLIFVPVDFEAGDSWWAKLNASGFAPEKPAIVSSLGVAMYLTTEAIMATLRAVAALAPGSTLAMSFLLRRELIDEEDRPGLDAAEKGARARGTPFISFFTPEEAQALAREAGFKSTEYVSPASVAARYFAGRADGLRPSSGEAILLAST